MLLRGEAIHRNFKGVLVTRFQVVIVVLTTSSICQSLTIETLYFSYLIYPKLVKYYFFAGIKEATIIECLIFYLFTI